MDEFSQVEGGSSDPTGITIKFNPYNYLNLRKFKSRMAHEKEEFYR